MKRLFDTGGVYVSRFASKLSQLAAQCTGHWERLKQLQSVISNPSMPQLSKKWMKWRFSVLYPNVPEYVCPYNPATEIYVMPLQFEGWVGTRNKLGTIPPNVGLIWVLKFLIALSNFKPFSTFYIDTFVPSKTILEKIIVKYGSAQLLTYLIKCPPDIRRVDTPHHFWNFWKSDF